MKISRPFSGLLSALGTGYITAVLCGVCGIREWGALFVTIAVGGLTGAGVVLADDDAEVRGPTSGLRKRANPTPPLAAPIVTVPKLPDINQDPLAVEINEAAMRAGLIEKPRYYAKNSAYLELINMVEERLKDHVIICDVEDVSIVDLPHGHPEAKFKIYRNERPANDLESPL